VDGLRGVVDVEDLPAVERRVRALDEAAAQLDRAARRLFVL